MFDIETDLGTCSLYLKIYTKQEENKATNKCFMVRYPGMLIQSFSYANYNISALCIINDNLLGQTLLNIENPQHTSWQVERIEDLVERREVRNIINTIKEQINDHILSVLKSGEALPIDPLGAGDYLPDVDNGQSPSSDAKSKASNDEVTATKFKPVKSYEKNPREEADDGTALRPIEGTPTEEGADIQVPGGHNKGHGGGSHAGNETKGVTDGDSIVFKNEKLKGVRYKVISIDKARGALRIILTSPIEAENCYLKLGMLDDSNNSTSVEIVELRNNGTPVSSIDSVEYGPFHMRENERVVLELVTNRCEYFGCEVRIICK